MRMQFGTISLLTLMTASLTAGSGCSDLSYGQSKAPAGAPQLTRLTIQDLDYFQGYGPQRAAIVDLLDNTPPVACAVNNPCVTEFLIAQTIPDLTCHSDGFCVDPLKVTSAGVPLSGGNTAIRVVFNKQLDPSIETTNVDANGAQLPNQTNALHSGILELLKPDGTDFPITAFWDNSGATTFTSDVIWVPFGPAIVTGGLLLNPSTTYTIRIHPALLKSEQGLAATDTAGVPLADPTDFKFTTEDLTANEGFNVAVGACTGPGGSCVTFTSAAASPTTIAPNDVVQYAYWENVDETTVVFDPTASKGPAGFNVASLEAYADRGASPVAADCSAALNATVLDLVYTSGTGAARVPADWPAGSYSLVISTAKGLGGGVSAPPSDPIIFTVTSPDTTDPTMDPIAVANHVTPEQCK